MADDIASLGFAIDSSDLKTGAEELRNLEAIAKKTGETAQQVEGRFKTLAAGKVAETEATKKSTTATEAANAAHTRAASVANNTAREVAGLSRAFGVLGQEAQSSASSLGRIGSFLMAFGTPGVVVGATLATLVVVLHALSEAAERLGEKALAMKAFATITGLTTDQIQVLTRTAEELGVQAGVVETFLDRMTVNVAGLKTASGPLYDQLLKINSALAEQAVNVKSPIELLDLLAKAYQQAGDKRNALLVAAGGRGGVLAAPLIDAIGSAGGVAGLVAHLPEAITLTQAEVKEIANLQSQFKKLKDENADLFAKMFSSDVLAGQVEYQHGLNTILTTWKDIRANVDAFLAKVLPAGRFNPFIPPSAQVPPAGGYGFGKTSEAYGPAAPAAAAAPAVPNPEALANQYKALNAALGSAATASDNLKARQAEINALFATGKFAVGGLTDAEAKLNRDRAMAAAVADTALQLTNSRIAALGQMASVDEIVRAKEMSLNAERRKGVDISDAEMKKLLDLTRQQAIGVTAIKAQTDAVTIQAATLGMSAGAAAAYTAVETRRLEAIRNGKPLTDAQVEALRKEAAALGERTQKAAQDAAQRQADFDLETVFMSDLDKQIAQIQRSLHGDDWKSFMNDGLAATMRLTAGMKSVKDIIDKAAESLAQGFVSNLMQGKSVMDSLTLSARSLSQTLANQSITELFKGNLIGAAVSGIGSFFAGLFGASQKTEEELNKIADRLTGFKIALADMSTDTLSGALAAQELKAQQARLDEQRAGGEGMKDLEKLLAAQELKIRTDFADKAIAAEKQAADQLQAVRDAAAQRQQSFLDREFAATNDSSTLTGALAAFERKAAQERAAEALLGNDAIVELERALSAERLQIETDFATKAAQAEKQAADQLQAVRDAAAQRQQSFLDREFAATNDSSTLTGALAAFERKAAQERAAEALAGNGAIVELERALSAERLQIETDFATKAADAAKQAADAAAQRMQSWQDKLFNLTNDTSTVEGQLAALEHQQQRDRQTEIDAGGQAILDVENYYAAARLKVVEDNDKKILQDQINTFKTIQAYLDSLQGGANSTLSPIEKLAAARVAYDRELALAKSGDQDAAHDITRYAEDFRQASRAVNASSAAFQSDLSYIQSSLQSLKPAGAHLGGLIPGYAGGGMVGNGLWNMDSVIARYQGGLGVALGGGEFVTRAPSVNAATFSALNYINQTGRAPAANDNRELLAAVNALRHELSVALAATASASLQGAGIVAATVKSEGSRNRGEMRQAKNDPRKKSA